MLEVEAAVDAIAHPRPEPYAAVPVLCQDVLQAFGRRGGLRVRDESGKDISEVVRREWRGGPEQFDACQADAERQLDRSRALYPLDVRTPARPVHSHRQDALTGCKSSPLRPPASRAN
jgi:hypothetical protein